MSGPSSYQEAYNLYNECKLLLIEEFSSTVSFKDEPNLIMSHMHTVTPTFHLTELGYIRLDKDMCGPDRYLSLYTGITGGLGFHSYHLTPNFVLSIFKLMYKIKTKTISHEDALIEGKKLRIEDRAINYYYKEVLL